jgi:hypothetical protein
MKTWSRKGTREMTMSAQDKQRREIYEKKKGEKKTYMVRRIECEQKHTKLTSKQSKRRQITFPMPIKKSPHMVTHATRPALATATVKALHVLEQNAVPYTETCGRIEAKTQ